MIVSGYIATTLDLSLFPNERSLFWLGAPMIIVMIINYVVAVVVSWPLFQTPMLSIVLWRIVRSHAAQRDHLLGH